MTSAVTQAYFSMGKFLLILDTIDNICLSLLVNKNQSIRTKNRPMSKS